MNKLILTLCFVFYASIASAGDFVFHTGEQITGKRASCGRVCSSRPDALRVDSLTYQSTTLKWHKVVNGVVVEKTQQEKDAIIQAEADALAQAEIDRQLAFDNALDGSSVSDAVMTKVDAEIDAIASYADLKAFLKKLVRYIYKQ